MPRLQNILQNPNGKLEAIAGILLLIGATVGMSRAESIPAWQLIAAGMFLVWAMTLAPGSGIRSTGVIGCVVVGLFIADVEYSVFVAVLVFFVIEVQLTNARWSAGTLSILLVLVWFAVGKPLSAWSVSSIGQILFAVLGVSIAAVFALYRRLNMSLHKEKATAIELAEVKTRVDMARALHNGVADSLTRIVLLTNQQTGDSVRENLIHQEAQVGVRELRKIIDELKGAPGMKTKTLMNLVEVIENSKVELELLGFEVDIESSVPDEVIIDTEIAVAFKEVMTNVMKHGANPVRISAEIAGGRAHIYVMNGIRDVFPGNVEGSGVGMAAVRSTLVARGGSVEFLDESGMMRTFLEFPIEKGW